MENETKEREYAKDLQVKITKVQVLQGIKNPEEVSKVVFETDKGRITWKPKAEKAEFRRGIEVVTTKPATFDDLPENLFAISIEVNQKGFATVKVSYNVWNTVVDGSPVTYRYVQGEKMFQDWELVKEVVPTETINKG